MAKDFKTELKNMERLINFGMNESKKSTDSKGIVEYSQLGADGNTYGIIKEGTKYYVKVAPKKNTEILAEDYDYVGGFNNRKSYDSYTRASQALNFQLMSVNEAVGSKKPVKSQYAINESAEWQNTQTKEARQELNRFYQLVNNVDNLLNENVHYVRENKEGGDPFTNNPSKKDGGGHKGNVGSQQQLGIKDKTYVHGAKNVNADSIYQKNGVKGTSPSGKYEAACGDHDIDEDGGNPYQNKAKKNMNESEVLAWRGDRAFVHNSSDSELDRSHGTEIGDTAPYDNAINEEENDWGSEGLPGKPGIGDPKGYKEPFTNNTKQPVSEDYVFEVEMDDIDGTDEDANPMADTDTSAMQDAGMQQPMMEGTVLDDFGKHPAYQKKVMSLPQNADSSKWGRDWNDDSTKGEKPYGVEIGSSAPFTDAVETITNAIVSELGKKKRLNEATYLNLGNNGAPAPAMPAAGAPAAPDPMAGGMTGADPNAMGGMPPADPNAMGGMPPADPNAMGADPNAMGGMPPADPNAMGGMPSANGNGFDMGIGMTPDEDPKKYIEGAVAKVATELRKYQQGLPKPDMELNKTAVNTIAAATKTGIQPNQVDELMTSYADAMRREDGEGSDGSDGGDIGVDPMAGGDAGTDMGGDPTTMGGDQMAGAGTDQTPLQERLNKALREFFQRRKEKKDQSPKGEIEQLEQRDSFSRKPFTPPVSK